MFESERIYGLRILANLPLPGLSRASTGAPSDIRLSLRSTPDWLQALLGGPAETRFICPDTDENGRPYYVVSEISAGEYYRLRYSDGAEFIVDYAGDRIWADWPEVLTPDDVATYLFGPVIGWVLRLRGYVCLHASAIAVNGAAIAFVGPSGAGKSTTAAAFSKRGHGVLADDVVAIFRTPGGLHVRPSHPELRLWPASMAALSHREDDRSEFVSRNGKFRLNLLAAGQDFQQEPLPLAAAYILNDDDPPGRNDIRTLSHRQAMLALVANTHAGRLLDQSGRRNEFDLLAALVEDVPVREVHRSAELDQLPQLCDAILSDFRNQIRPSSITEAAGA